MSKNKIKIVIAGNEFTVVTDENENSAVKTAEEVNESIAEVQRANPTASVTAAVILTALNYCDTIHEMKKEAEQLQQRMKQCLDENAEDKKTISELQRENEKLRADIDTYRKRLGENPNGAPVSSSIRHPKKGINFSVSEEAAEDETDLFG